MDCNRNQKFTLGNPTQPLQLLHTLVKAIDNCRKNDSLNINTLRYNLELIIQNIKMAF